MPARAFAPCATTPFDYPPPLRALCAAAVFVTFAGLVTLRGPASPGSMGALLALLGMVLAATELRLLRDDVQLTALFLVLPLYHVLNMAWTGWDPALLDKPGRLVFGLFVYVALSRVGVGARALRWGAIAGCITAAGLAVYQLHVLHAGRAHGVMNAIPFGNDSLLLAFLAAAGWATVPRAGRGSALTVSTLIAVGAGLYASLASGTRGGWIVIPVLAWVLSLGAGDVRRRVRPGVTAATVALLAVAAILLAAVHDRTAAELGAVREVLAASPAAAATMALSSLGARLHLYRIGIDAFLASPLVGIGFANLAGHLAAGAEAGLINPAVTHFTHLHSSVVDTLGRGGALGMLALGCFGFGFIRYFLRALATATDCDTRYFALVGLLAISAALLFSLSNVLFPAIVGTNVFVMTIAVPAGALAHRVRHRTSAAFPAVDGVPAGDRGSGGSREKPPGGIRNVHFAPAGAPAEAAPARLDNREVAQ